MALTPFKINSYTKRGGGARRQNQGLPTPSRGLSRRTKSESWIGSDSHSTAIVFTGWSGASVGSPLNRTRNQSCSNFTGCPVASSLHDFTPLFSPESATPPPRQKDTFTFNVFHLR